MKSPLKICKVIRTRVDEAVTYNKSEKIRYNAIHYHAVYRYTSNIETIDESMQPPYLHLAILHKESVDARQPSRQLLLAANSPPLNNL